MARQQKVQFFAPVLLGHQALTTVEPHSFMGEVDRLARLVQAAKVSGAHLLGYSLGARMALGLMVRHPQLFSKATLIGVHPGLRDPAARQNRITSDARWSRLLSQSITVFLDSWECQPLFVTQANLSSTQRAKQDEIRRSHTAVGLRKSLSTVGLGQMPNFWTVARTWQRPLTIVTGSEDTKFGQLAEKFMTHRTTDGSRQKHRIVQIRSCGHNVPLEAPESLARVLLEQA